jgi:hypothetical protein
MADRAASEVGPVSRGWAQELRRLAAEQPPVPHSPDCLERVLALRGEMERSRDDVVASSALDGAPAPTPEWRQTPRRVATGELDADEVISAEVERAKRKDSDADQS